MGAGSMQTLQGPEIMGHWGYMATHCCLYGLDVQPFWRSGLILKLSEGRN